MILNGFCPFPEGINDDEKEKFIMKTSSKISIIATVSTLAVVGTAFAAWQFNKEAEKVSNSNVVITKDDGVGEITLEYETFYLTLDQDLLAWTSVDNTDAETPSGEITSNKVTYTGSAKSSDVSDVTLSVEFTVDSALSTYVSVSGGSLGARSESGNVLEQVYTLPTLAWVAGKKPTTQKDFDAMKAALAGAKVADYCESNL